MVGGGGGDMGRVKVAVLTRLEGIEVRQAHREAARSHQRILRRVQQASRDGRLNEITKAESYLQGIGCSWTTHVRYGMTLVTTAVGVFLPYRPNGLLDATTYHRRKKDSLQHHLFSDELSA
jgi:hypothetical protein